MEKRATTDFPIHDLIARRWSPRAFEDREVGGDEIGSLMEAARWAPSSYNEQPWQFIVATKKDPAAFDRMLDCLVEANQKWARSAPVLVMALTRTRFARNGKPNRHAFHDLGLALGNLSLQAQSQGLAVHQMAGFDIEKTRRTFRLPEDVEPVTALAIGRIGTPASLPDELREAEIAPRSRRGLEQIVFEREWGEAWSAS